MQNQDRLLHFAVNAGEITMTSGAEAYRAEETISRILATGEDNIHSSLVLGTGIFASIHKKDGKDYTALKRIKNNSINLEKIADINSLTRAYIKGKLTIDEAENQLDIIRSKKGISRASKILAMGVTSAMFVPLFSGVLSDLFAGAIVGLILGFFTTYFENISGGIFMSNFLGGAIIGSVVSLLSWTGIIVNMDSTIISSLMPLVPGAMFTNAIRDIIEGDYVSGSSRIMQSIIVAVSLAAGVSFGLFIIRPKFLPINTSVDFLSNPLINIFFAGAATYCFAVLFNLPQKQRIPTTIIGMIGWAANLLSRSFSGNAVYHIFIGSLMVSFLSRAFAYERKVPSTVFFIPGIIAYVPGAAVYYTMDALREKNIIHAFSKGMEAVTMAGVIAISVAIIQLIPAKVFINISSFFKKIRMK